MENKKPTEKEIPDFVTEMISKIKTSKLSSNNVLDMLEENGVVGPGDGAKPRDVLVGETKNIPGVPRVGENDEEVVGDY